MPDFLESLERSTAYALCGRGAGCEFRMFRLQLLKLAQQNVVFGVRNLRIVERVIAVVVVGDLRAQGLHTLPRIFRHATFRASSLSLLGRPDAVLSRKVECLPAGVRS